MRVHVLQHVPFEWIGSIGPWLDARGADITATRFFQGDALPDIDSFDWLIAMGGPMSVNDEEEHPWLADEKRFVREAIDASKTVLGVCLGAQLIASALGARVFRNPDPEIGWFPVTPAASRSATPFSDVFPTSFEAYHWHGETFDLPDGAVRLARSEACENQAYAVGERVLGLQFHLETTPESAALLCEHCGEELREAPWIQRADEMLRDPGRFEALNARMVQVLEALGLQ